MTDDMSDMYRMVMEFPELLTKFKIDQNTKNTCARLGERGLGGIVTLGMGGSAISGFYVQSLLRSKAAIPIIMNNTYSLPRCVDSSWVAIAVSYSGNTEETLTAFDEALNRKCQTITVASGGGLHERKESSGRIEIPAGYQPRAAFPLIFSVVLKLVEGLLALDPINLDKIGKRLSEDVIKWNVSNTSPQATARNFVQKIPLFIGSSHLIPVAYRAKCQINENAKTLGFYSEIPEANHNEIEGFVAKNSLNIVPVFLRSSYENDRINKRMDITFNLYKDEGYSPLSLSVESASKAEEMMAMTFYLDLVSVELARIRKVDPLSVDRISRLKKELS